MEKENEEKMKKMIIDGQIVDLDNMPLEDLKRIQKRLEEKEKEIKKQIEEELER